MADELAAHDHDADTANAGDHAHEMEISDNAVTGTVGLNRTQVRTDDVTSPPPNNTEVIQTEGDHVHALSTVGAGRGT